MWKTVRNVAYETIHLAYAFTDKVDQDYIHRPRSVYSCIDWVNISMPHANIGINASGFC